MNAPGFFNAIIKAHADAQAAVAPPAEHVASWSYEDFDADDALPEVCIRLARLRSYVEAIPIVEPLPVDEAAERAKADAAMFGLIGDGELLKLSAQHRRFLKEAR